MVAIAKSNKLGGFKHRKCLLWSSGSQKSKSRCPEGHTLPKLKGRIHPLLLLASGSCLHPLAPGRIFLLHFHVASPFWAPPKLLSTHLPSFLHFSLQLFSFIPYQVMEPASPTPCIHSPAIHIISCLRIFTVFEGWLLDANSDFSC